MQPHPANRILESVFVEMDPLMDGFGGVLAELCFTGEEYRLSLTAAGTGNRLLTFTSENAALAHYLLHQEITGGCCRRGEAVASGAVKEVFFSVDEVLGSEDPGV